MKTLKAMVSGRVQGVGFRYFVKRHADKLGLNGYARNLIDGRVEVLMQGDLVAIESLLNQLKIGPGYSVVEAVDSDEVSDSPPYINFDIR